MAKKIKNNKLLKSAPATNNRKTAFSDFAIKAQAAKQKKIEKMSETKQRLMKNRQNKLVRLPGNVKKMNKFALMDEEENQTGRGLTHRGKRFTDIKNFNDVKFGDDDIDIDKFDELQNELNFQGFEEGQNQGKQKKFKTKNQIYKQIIEKSKKYKRERQQQYEQNLQAAIELDQQFNSIAGNLKYTTQGSKLRQKIQKKDRQYEKLLNQLKQDERVTANRVVDNNKKGSQKIKRKKNEQLNQLMKNEDDEDEEDIRGWIDGVSQNSGSPEDDEEDELDDIQLSSGDQGEEDQGSEQQSQNQQGDGQDQIDSQQQDQSNQQNQEESQQQIQIVEQLSSESPVKNKGRKRRKH